MYLLLIVVVYKFISHTINTKMDVPSNEIGTIAVADMKKPHVYTEAFFLKTRFYPCRLRQSYWLKNSLFKGKGWVSQTKIIKIWKEKDSWENLALSNMLQHCSSIFRGYIKENVFTNTNLTSSIMKEGILKFCTYLLLLCFW
jgi:hypothetical protein